MDHQNGMPTCSEDLACEGAQVPRAGLEIWESKLCSILREMEMCKAGLSTCRLDPHQTSAVSKLIATLEEQVEQLDRSIAAKLVENPSRPDLASSHADARLDDLGDLCSRLMLTIFCWAEGGKLPA
jgi:hypothetical protein